MSSFNMMLKNVIWFFTWLGFGIIVAILLKNSVTGTVVDNTLFAGWVIVDVALFLAAIRSSIIIFLQIINFKQIQARMDNMPGFMKNMMDYFIKMNDGDQKKQADSNSAKKSDKSEEKK